MKYEIRQKWIDKTGANHEFKWLESDRILIRWRNWYYGWRHCFKILWFKVLKHSLCRVGIHKKSLNDWGYGFCGKVDLFCKWCQRKQWEIPLDEFQKARQVFGLIRHFKSGRG